MLSQKYRIGFEILNGVNISHMGRKLRIRVNSSSK